MSLDPILWALKDAPVADQAERLILVTMAEKADEDGCNAYQSAPTIARAALVHHKTVRRRLDALRKRGLIAYGDPAAAAHIPAHRRPTVYDLQIPYAWFSNIDRVNDARASRGRGPLTREDRPDLPDAPPRKRRRDAGKPRDIHRVDYKSSLDSESPPDSQSQSGGTTSPPTLPLEETHPSSSEPNATTAPPPVDDRSEEEADPEADAVLARVAEAWHPRLGATACARLRPLVSHHLGVGHRPATLVEELTRNQRGVGLPYAVLRKRLEDLLPPRRPRLGPKCGRCDSDRWLVDDEGRPIRRCECYTAGSAGDAASGGEAAKEAS